MMGYLKNEEETKKVIDAEGRIHSGDLGIVDENGFVEVTGRIKELIITAGGENIAPLIIEDNFKSRCAICSNIMVVGENRKFISALITLKVETINGNPTNNLNRECSTFLKSLTSFDI